MHGEHDVSYIPSPTVYQCILCKVRVMLANGAGSLVKWAIFLFLLHDVSGVNERQAFAIEKIDLAAIAQIESSGNPLAVNPRDPSYGLFQITPGVLKEWNAAHKSQRYGLKDLLDPQVNTSVADWYLNRRIPAMLRSLKLPVTLPNLIICYNAGCGAVKKGRIPPVTQEYLLKYHRIAYKAALLNLTTRGGAGTDKATKEQK